MKFYVRHDKDPEWLAAAASFHGHLGPWVTIGAMIGRDAVTRLETPGQWEIDVVCWMGAARQRPPFSCILDGLQATTGATLGKQNIRFEDDPIRVTDDQPTVQVTRPAREGRPAARVTYRLTPALIERVASVTPATLETVSRQIAATPLDELFVVETVDAKGPFE